jgi:hypothetical protein
MIWVQARQRDVRKEGRTGGRRRGGVKVRNAVQGRPEAGPPLSGRRARLSDLQSTVGVELFQGKSGGKVPQYDHIKQRRSVTHLRFALNPAPT